MKTLCRQGLACNYHEEYILANGKLCVAWFGLGTTCRRGSDVSTVQSLWCPVFNPYRSNFQGALWEANFYKKRTYGLGVMIFLLLELHRVAKKRFIFRDFPVNFLVTYSQENFQLNYQMTQVVVYMC